MRKHLEVALGTAAALVLVVALGGCTREESARGPRAPSESTSTPYSTTNTGSRAYGNAGVGYSEPLSKGGNDFDHGNVGGTTGSTDNVPTGVGGGPMDKGAPKPNEGDAKETTPCPRDVPLPLEQQKPKK